MPLNLRQREIPRGLTCSRWTIWEGLGDLGDKPTYKDYLAPQHDQNLLPICPR